MEERGIWEWEKLLFRSKRNSRLSYSSSRSLPGICIWDVFLSGADTTNKQHCRLAETFLDEVYQMWLIALDLNWTSSWENLSSGVSDQVKLASSATEASMRLEILVTVTRDIILSKQRTTKALIRPCGCAGWSVPLLFAYDIRHIFSWPGSTI